MSGRPEWLRTLAQRVEAGVDPAYFSAFLPPERGGRASAVLMLFAPDAAGRDSVLLTERACGLRSHAGQVAFPGGRVDPGDAGPVAAALREANEEVGLEPGDVDVVGQLPALFVPVSDSVVTTVVGWSPTPPHVWARSPREVVAVRQVPLAELADPAHRIVATHPNGYVGHAFDTPQLYIWGFTAGLLSRVLSLTGLERPWDQGRARPLPERFGAPRTPDEAAP